MKDVIISITGSQQPDGEEKNSIQLETDGHYSFHDGVADFDYMESELTGMAGTRTEFKVTPESVSIIRNGTVNTQMMFMPGRKNYFLYDTPFGAATLGLDTKLIKSDLGKSGGSLEVRYHLNSGDTLVSKNDIRISIREM